MTEFSANSKLIVSCCSTGRYNSVVKLSTVGVNIIIQSNDNKTTQVVKCSLLLFTQPFVHQLESILCFSSLNKKMHVDFLSV